MDVASIYDFKYQGCVRRLEKTWECLVECILHLKMNDSSGDLVVSIVRVIFFIVGGNGSGESRVSDEPNYPGNLNRWSRMLS